MTTVTARALRMSDSNKLERYMRHMAAKGVTPATAFPPAGKMLWSMGLKVPPPPFLHFLALAVLTGGFFGPLFGIAVWVLGNRGLRTMPLGRAGWVMLVTGLAFGLAMAFYYRHMARKHRLGSWAAFSGSPCAPDNSPRPLLRD